MFELDKIKFSDKELAKCAEVLDKSWMSVHAATVHCTHTPAHLAELLRLLAYEKHHGQQRQQIMHRLYRKAAAIRKVLEENALYE